MIYLNNRLVADSRAKVSVFDHGFLYGDGVYETLRAYNGTVFMIREHIERLFMSASKIDLKIPVRADVIRRAVYKTIRANRQKNAYIRISVSRGAGPIGLDPELCPKPTLVIISRAFRGYPRQYYGKGVKIAIVGVRRNSRDALNPEIKSLNFLNNILARMEARKEGAYEAVMLNSQGYLAEGSVTNIFFIRNNVLFTPSLEVGILDGITRRIILDMARRQKIPTREGRFTPLDLYRSDEVFISNTTMEIMPVTTVDDVRIGDMAGRTTKFLRSGFRKLIEKYVEHDNGYDQTRKDPARFCATTAGCGVKNSGFSLPGVF